jgi:hypothetical protein
MHLTKIPPMMKLKSLQLFCRNASSILAGSLTLAVAANAIHTEQSAAIDLKFNSIDTTRSTYNVNGPIPGSANGEIVTSNSVFYKNVANGVDAKITATATGSNYRFDIHEVNYTAAGNSNGDSAFDYSIRANSLGQGGLTYQIELFTTTGGVHNFTTAYVAPELRFLVYDVDGESLQSEAVRIAKSASFIGYQTGTSANALIPSSDATSYLFSGRNANISETDASSAAMLYFANTNTVTLNFEANTTTASTNRNYVFSAIDGDLSIIGATGTPFNSRTFTGYNAFVSTSTPTTAVPEPFTIIGTLVGGTAALRMRKKLKAST